MSKVDERIRKAVGRFYESASYDSEKGIFKVEDSRLVLFFCDSLASVQKRMESLVGYDAADMLLYEAYKEAGRTNGVLFAKNMKAEKVRGTGIILAALEFMRIAAWGCWELTEYDKLKTGFGAEDSPLAELYGKSERPVCHPIRGLIAGFAEFFTGQKRECVEALCKAKGDEHCEFIVARPEEITRIALERLEKK